MQKSGEVRIQFEINPPPRGKSSHALTPEVNLPPEDVTADRKGLILYLDKLRKYFYP